MLRDFKTLANPFQFADLDVRTATDEHSEVWFCAKDVCAALDISWSSMILENMPDNWKGVIKLITPGGEQSANFINEAGLYHMIFRSNKPKAKEFANWVCETVLPEIRKTGFFGALEIKDQLGISKQIAALAAQITDTKNAFQRRLLMDQFRRLCNLVSQPIPPTDWIALNHDQVDLFSSNGGGA
jgi:prophage antirepressor-like protein